MCLGLREEDLFALLLRCEKLHHSTDVATVKVTEELYLTLNELMHWHEGGLLCGTKPVDELVTNIWEPGNCLKIIHDSLVEVCLCMLCFSGASLGNFACPFC
jgi:hypothetical protein